MFNELISIHEKIKAVEMIQHTMQQSLIRENKLTYLPIPSGLKIKMMQGSLVAEQAYEDYGNKGRVPSTVVDTYNSIMGLSFKNEPSFPDFLHDLKIATSGHNVSELLMRVFSHIIISGYCALIVSSETESLSYLSYSQISNVQHDGSGALSNISIQGDNEDNSYSYEKIGDDVYYVQGESRKIISFDFIPVVVINASDDSGLWKEIPLQGVAECIVSYYQLSCESRRALSDSVDPTLIAKGVTAQELDAAYATGKGFGSAWASHSGDFYYLESNGGGVDKVNEAMDKELFYAQEKSMKIISSGNSKESEEAIRIRRASQTQSINTIADNVSTGVSKAIQMLFHYRYIPLDIKQGDIRINIDDSSLFTTTKYGDILLRLGNIGKVPDSVIFNYLKKTGALTGTDIYTVDDYKSQLTNSGEV